MKIFSAEQLNKCDIITCEKQNIQSKELILRAANSFVDIFTSSEYDQGAKTLIFCGPGNNGADGIAIAKLLYSRYYEVELVLIVEKDISKCNESFQFYLDNPVDQQPFPVHIIRNIKQLDDLEDLSIFIDAIFGTGNTRPLTGLYKSVVEWINGYPATIISVDIPSGIQSDTGDNYIAIDADMTISFQLPKLSFFHPDCAKKIGKWIITDIGCDKDFIENEKVNDFWIEKYLVTSLLIQRDRFAHKGNFGHSYIISGSYGKIGATILCSKAALRIGSGLVTIHAPSSAYEILQMSVPEAMVDADPHKYYISEVSFPARCNAIAIGPGIGTQNHTQRMMDELFCKNPTIPMVIDADGLNLMSIYPEILSKVPKNAIITPHVKEFERLFGSFSDHSKMLSLQREKSISLGIYIVLKGGYTTLSCPDGEIYYNTNGNPGMATGGSGDVLTGIIVGLLAQGYTPKVASILGIYIHGMAGDMAILNGQSYESLLASDIIDNLGRAYNKMRT